MINGKGEIVRTYQENCDQYEPDKERPKRVRSERLGQLFDCKAFKAVEDGTDRTRNLCINCINKPKV